MALNRYTPPTFLQQFKTKDVDRRPVVLLCGAGAAKGKRPYMEDVNFSFPSVRISGNSYCSVFGVLDGHGGVECSRFAVEELPTQVHIVVALDFVFCDASRACLVMINASSFC